MQRRLVAGELRLPTVLLSILKDTVHVVKTVVGMLPHRRDWWAQPLKQCCFCVLMEGLAFILTACQTNAPVASTPTLPAPLPTSGNERAVTITFACYEWQRREFEDLADGFHALNPGIQVQILAFEDLADFNSIGLGSEREVVYRIVSSADTAWWPVTPDATRVGLLRDLTPFVEADRTFEPDDFFPHMLEAFQWDGGTWALPSQAELTLIFYDKNAFDAAGVPYPHPGWTLDDFLATAQQLTVREGDAVERYGFVDLFSSGMEAFVVGQAGTLVNEAGAPALDTPAVADAVHWYADLALVHGVMPPRQATTDGYFQEMDALVGNGRAAMWTDVLGNLEPKGRTFDLGVVPFPQGNEKFNPAWIYGYLMSAGTAHPQEAWRWLNFLSHQRIAGPFGQFLDQIPARRSVAEQANYWARFDEETAAAVQYAVEHILFPAWDEAAWELSEAVRQVFEGEMVEVALANAQAAALERATERRAAQATPWPVVVATPRPEGATGETTVTFAPSSPDITAYRQLAAVFNEESPDIRVQIVSPDEAASADCFAGVRSVTDEGSRTELLSLQPLIEADTSFSLDDFYPRFLDAFRYQGSLLGLPTQAQVRVVFYNRDLFDAAGVPRPEPGWTLDDFLARAIALTEGSGDEKRYGFLPLNGDASDLPVFVALQGAALWDETGQPRFDALDVVAAVRWYTDLALRYGVMPAFPDDLSERDPTAQETRYALVREGRVAMWTDFTGVDRSTVWPTDAQVGMAPLPAMSKAERPVGAEGVTEFLYEGLFIAADTPYPQACWEWLKFASAQAVAVRGVPARRSLLESATFVEQAGEEAVATYSASLEYAEAPPPATPEASAQLHYLYHAVAEVLIGTRPETALVEAQRQAER